MCHLLSLCIVFGYLTTDGQRVKSAASSWLCLCLYVCWWWLPQDGSPIRHERSIPSTLCSWELEKLGLMMNTCYRDTLSTGQTHETPSSMLFLAAAWPPLWISSHVSLTDSLCISLSADLFGILLGGHTLHFSTGCVQLRPPQACC